MEQGVSREHAEIVEAEGGLLLRDLGSTNGTFVNRRKIADEGQLLKDGDRIRLGAATTTFVFRVPVTEAEESPASATEAKPAEPPVEAGAALPAVAEAVSPVTRAIERPATATITRESEVEEPPPQPRSTTGRLVATLRSRLSRPTEEAPAAEVAATVHPPVDETHFLPQPLSVRARRVYRNLRRAVELKFRNRTVAVSVEGNVIRALLFDGNEIVGWGISDPNEGNTSTDDGVGPMEETDRIRVLLEGLDARYGRFVTDLPFYTPLIRQFELPEKTRGLLQQIVEQEVLDKIPFAADEVDIKYQRLRESNEAVAIAVRRQLVDSHVDVIKTTGLGPAATYSQATALGLAAGVPDAVLVHLQEDRTAVILIQKSVPRAVHQVLATGGDESIEDKAEALARAVEQVEGFGQTHEEADDGVRVPVVVSGRVPENGDLTSVLRAMLSREILTPSPPVEYPEGFPVSEYTNAIGLALLDQARPTGFKSAPAGDAVPLSLLSPRHLPAPLPIVPVSVFLALTLFAVAVFNLTPRVDDIKVESDALVAQLVATEEEAARHRLSAKTAEVLQLRAREARQLALAMSAQLNDLAGRVDDIAAWFEKIETITVKTKPEGVTVSEFTLTRDIFELKGLAPTVEDAILYSNNIKDSGLFEDVVLRRFSAGGGAPSGPAVGGTSPADILAGLAGGAQPAAPVRRDSVVFVIEASVPGASSEEDSAP